MCVRLGLQYRYQQGKVQVCTNRFLGYDKDEEGKLIINPEEINASADINMSLRIKKYRNIVDIDFMDMKMESYKTDENLQTAAVGARLRLLKYSGWK